MPNISVPKFGAALAANAGTDGTLQVADTTNLYVGQFGWLSDTTGLTKKVVITSITDGTHVKAMAVADDGSNVNQLSYAAGSNLSTFTLANGSRLDCPQQVVRVNQPTFSKPNAF
jgi:hypothetical protein